MIDSHRWLIIVFGDGYVHVYSEYDDVVVIVLYEYVEMCLCE